MNSSLKWKYLKIQSQEGNVTSVHGVKSIEPLPLKLQMTNQSVSPGTVACLVITPRCSGLEKLP